MSLLDSEKRIGLSDLCKTTCVDNKKVKGILNFLMRYNLIKISNGYLNSSIIEKV